jgi:hypothetical protein
MIFAERQTYTPKMELYALLLPRVETRGYQYVTPLELKLGV